MKKFVIGLLLILSMCAFGFTYYYLYGNKELAGEKITDGVYLYDTKVGDYNRSISVYDGNIYSLVEIDKNYELYKYDLYKNENKRIGVVDSLEKFCYIDEEYITCLGDNRTIYDLKLKKLYDVKDRNIIPYKKGFIEAKGNKLYYKEKEYAKLGDDKEYSLSTYYKFDDNIYIVVTNTENGTCLYDFNNKKCKKLDNVAINKYDNGLFMYDDNKIYIDSFDSKDLEYNIPIDREFLYDSKYHNNLLYYFADDYLRIYNLDNDKVRFLDYRINISIYKTFLEDNILFIITSEDKVYAFKLDEVTFSEEQTLDELNKYSIKE